jgi:putative RNA 2'-phosphotransferase
MNRRQIQISKFLSLVLRHRPQKIGITLDEGGWTAVADLLEACGRHGFPITAAELQAVVAENDKARFSFSAGGSRIRATQGHSVPVQLGYEPVEPPPFLFHGTAARFVDAILERGLLKGKRHHVHLSEDEQTARQVGQRHGRPVIFRVHSGAMHRDGHPFYRSENGVWLVEAAPPDYLEPVADDRDESQAGDGHGAHPGNSCPPDRSGPAL